MGYRGTAAIATTVAITLASLWAAGTALAQGPPVQVAPYPPGAGEAAAWTLAFTAPSPPKAGRPWLAVALPAATVLPGQAYLHVERDEWVALQVRTAGHGATFGLAPGWEVGAWSPEVQVTFRALNPAAPGTYRLTALLAGGPPLTAAYRVVPRSAVGDPPAEMPLTAPPACGPWSRRQLDSPGCTRAALAAIDRARAAEGVGPMYLPSYYPHLTVPEQLLVVVDLEREARGLPIFLGLSKALDADAQQGADQGRDPVGPQDAAWGANWAGGSPSALLSDWVWMYDDGPGGANVDCTPSHRLGCWGHRDALLGDYGLDPVMGAAGRVGGGGSMAVLFAQMPLPPPGGWQWRVPPGSLSGLTAADSWPPPRG